MKPASSQVVVARPGGNPESAAGLDEVAEQPGASQRPEAGEYDERQDEARTHVGAPHKDGAPKPVAVLESPRRDTLPEIAATPTVLPPGVAVEPRPRPKTKRKPAVRLTDRDYQVLAVLAEARYLSMEHLRRLFFRGHVTGLRRRLNALAVAGRPLLKRLEWYSRDGVRAVWGLTPTGYIEAERYLEVPVDVPKDDISAEFLDHHVLLTDFYVGLLAPPVDAADAALSPGPERNRRLGTVYARAAHPGFTWAVVGDLSLPWKQPAGARLEAKVLRPDAVMTVPAQRRRLFVESEMGTHTIRSASASKAGSTLGKVERYEAYCSLQAAPGARKSFYAERFPDGFTPEVWFVVRTATRRDSVKKALDDWRRTHPKAACTFHVATAPEAVQQLMTAVGPAPRLPAAPPAPPAPSVGLPLSHDEVKALEAFLSATQADFKARRDRARLHKQPVPEYPAHIAEVHALVSRLRGG